MYEQIPSALQWAEHANGSFPYRTFSESFSRMLNLFENIQLSTPESLLIELRSLLDRQAAAESVAIEEFYELRPGESLSIARMDPGWRSVLESQGSGNVGLFESQLNSFTYARESIGQGVPVTQGLIKELHSISCSQQENYSTLVLSLGNEVREQRPLRHGEYKAEENMTVLRSGVRHLYCPVTETPIEMQKFVDEIRSEPFAQLSEVAKAAYVHYCITHIHPFSDGNGRVARALASAYTSNSIGVPLLVYADRRRAYQQAIELCAVGNFSAFISHIELRVSDALQYARIQLKSLRRGDVEGRLGRLVADAERHKDVRMRASADLAGELLEEIRRRADAEIRRTVDSSNGALVLVEDALKEGRTYSSYLTGHYRIFGGFQLGAELAQPSGIPSCCVYIATGYTESLSEDFVLYVGLSNNQEFSLNDPSIEAFLVVLEDVDDGISSALSDRIDALIEAAIEYILTALERDLESFLRQTGNLGL